MQDRINVLVTGGAGTVGSNLCDHLLSQKTYNVICVDNYFSGVEHNIDRLLSDPHFEFIRHDISEPLDFAHYPGVERFKTAFVGVQEIYHLAIPDAPRAYLPSPAEVLMLGATGTKHILDLALRHRAKVLLASDTNVIGTMPEGEAITEDTRGAFDFLDPLSVLASAQRYAETICETYRRLYNLDVRIVRMHNVYGPNMHFGDGRFIPEMIERALAGEEIVITPSLTAAPFLFLSDAVDALVRVMGLRTPDIYNLAHPTLYPLQEVVQVIIALTGSLSTVRQGPAPADEQELYAVWQRSCRAVSIAKIKEDAEWFPVVLLRDGLSQTIDYMKSVRGLADLRSIHKK
ncbi:NAD-dependent epimerase/dehydratase family protein [Candidatus Uhrbacteria bacterium]|nr:NAD-dependent epimerase/dehydratase family protein [Candidatus Uhrbacteria bacterium]